MAESEEELKSFLMKVKEENKKAGLKLNIKNKHHGILSHRIMVNKWGKNETMTDFIFLGSKITVHGDYSCEIKRYLLLGRKAIENLESM